jgi:hypothetical protein
MITDHRRDHRSATIPVGISNRNTAASITVPTSTSWRSSRPAVRNR